MRRIHINSKYKDRLFRMLFGREDSKEYTISLFNAVNGTDYGSDEIITITTLEDVIYVKLKNDISFVIDGYIPLWEHQSTVNPNMPLRGLLYFGELYGNLIIKEKNRLHGSTLVKIPTPQFVVFYNGTEEEESVKKLRLSDAFIHPTENGEFEWTATMYNLNRGKNEELLNKCKPLKEYMEFVERVRDNLANEMSIEESVDRAVNSCIHDGILKEYLMKNKTEVFNSVLKEFDEAEYDEFRRQEAMEIGIEKGIEKGRDSLYEVIEAIHEGKTPDDLVKSGVDKSTVDIALKTINMLCNK